MKLTWSTANLHEAGCAEASLEVLQVPLYGGNVACGLRLLAGSDRLEEAIGTG